MKESRVSLRSEDGLTLEGMVAAPEEPRGGIVLCHPHPQQGGTMNAPLLIDIRDRLTSVGLGVVRFNFRGIGASQGTSSDGIEETADAAGAVRLARERWPDKPIAIGGWSFGAGVAIRRCLHEELAACVAIAPPVKEKPGVSAGLPEPQEWPRAVPLLLVCAGRDHLVDLEACRAWAEVAGARLHEIPAANHFFWARYDALGDAIVPFLEAAIPT